MLNLDCLSQLGDENFNPLLPIISIFWLLIHRFFIFFSFSFFIFKMVIHANDHIDHL